MFIFFILKSWKKRDTKVFVGVVYMLCINFINQQYYQWIGERIDVWVWAEMNLKLIQEQKYPKSDNIIELFAYKNIKIIFFQYDVQFFSNIFEACIGPYYWKWSKYTKFNLTYLLIERRIILIFYPNSFWIN